MRRILLFASVLACAVSSFLSTFSDSELPAVPGHRSGALEALDFWSVARAYPDADIPADRYYRAFLYSQRRFKDINRTTASATVWLPKGPLNLHGRTISVAINPLNPNTVLIGTASGGLWRSFTGGLGADWHQIRLGHPALGIKAIAYHPADSNTIYLGTGEVYRYGGALGGLVVRTTRGSYGIGILKSTDGGESWEKSLDWSYNQQRGVQRIAVNPLNPKTIYAATTEGLYKTTDAGSSWSNIHSVIMAMDVVLHSSDTSKLLLSCGNFSSPGRGLYRSTNAGSSWSTIAGLPSFSGKTILGSYRANPNIVFASVADSTTAVGSLWRTTNFGSSWTRRSSSSTNGIFGVQGWYSHYPAVHPTDSSIVIHNSVSRSKSTDGGISFITPSGGYSDNHACAIDPVDNNIIYAVNDDGVYRSTDFGSSYTDVGFGLQTGQLYAGLGVSRSDSFLAIVQSQDHIPGYLYNGGMEWERSAADEAGWTAIDPSNDSIMYAISRFGGSFYKSYDRGASFEWQFIFDESQGAWNSPIVVSLSNPNILYVGTSTIFKSLDAGESWSEIYHFRIPTLCIAVSHTNPDTLYAGVAPDNSGAHIYRTTDGGTSWTDVIETLPNRYPLDLVVDPNNSRIVYVAFGGFGTGHLFKSTNAGGSWTDISGSLPDAPTTAIAIDPLNTSIVYAGNDIGVYISTDAGSTWSSFSEGLPDAVIISDLVISPSNRTLKAGTHGNGMYERTLYDGSSPPALDYRPFAVIAPKDGAEILINNTVTQFVASFLNAGVSASAESLEVQLRLLLNGAELRSSTKRTKGLSSGEIRPVAFDVSHVATSIGRHDVEVIVMTVDGNPSNDTLRTHFDVVSPTILQLVVTRVAASYEEISDGTPGPEGDDVQVSAPLPFIFTYDGIPYDQVQISTNGWIEFGTGEPGSEFGISTYGQLGGFFRQALNTSERPTKAVGAWWTDLSTTSTSPSGSVSYDTRGEAPNREFIVQWKDVLAYFDESASTLRLNFQIRLHETGEIGLSYGPKVAGTLNAYTGAAMGLKDAWGGDYRYYDIHRGGGGSAEELVRSLSPMTDWPGPDSLITIEFASGSSTVVLFTEGWNLVSLPRQPADRSALAVFPTSYAGTSYGYDGSYVRSDTLIVGRGYWLKFPDAGAEAVEGSDLSTVEVDVIAGWNMVGSVDREIAAPVGGIIAGSFFGYGDGYSTAATLKPGKGYWVKCLESGTITIGSTTNAARPRLIPQGLGALTITDRVGKRQAIFAGRNVDPIDLNYFEMPPVPPAGVFDARFASGRMVEMLRETGDTAEIKIQGAEFPISVSWRAGATVHDVVLVGPGSEGRRLENGMTLTVLSSGRLRLVAVPAGGSPAEFALHQNYPNPFNPTTGLSFALRQRSVVSLTVYNSLGQEVRAILSGTEMEAGTHEVEFTADGLASGVYVYRIHVREIGTTGTESGTFTAVKKMVMMK